MNNEEFAPFKKAFDEEYEKQRMAHDLRMLKLKEEHYATQRRWKLIMMLTYFALSLGVGWEIHNGAYGWAASHAMMAFWMAKNYFDDKFLNE